MGRPILAFTARKCKQCKVLYPRAEFEFPRPRAKTGKTIRPLCKRCHRQRDRERIMARYYSDPKYRERQLETHREWKAKNPDAPSNRGENRCRWAWIRNRETPIFKIDDKPIIICVKPKPDPPRASELDGIRRGKTLGIIVERAPVHIPRGWIPILRKDGAIITRHPSCPDEWAWTERIFETRYKAWKKAKEGAGPSDPQK